MADSNGRAPNKEAERLIKGDYTPLVGSLGYSRMISKAMLTNLLGEFDPEYIGYRRLYAMRRDPMVAMGLHYIKSPLIRASWHIECEDPAIAQGLDTIIRNRYANFLKTGLTKYEFGYQASIKQFELGKIDSSYEDDEGEAQPVWPDNTIQPVVLDALIPIPPEFAIVNLDPDTGEFLGFKTSLAGPVDVQTDSAKRTVPAEFALWWTNEFEETFRNYYGYPRTGYAFRYWWSYWFRHHMQDRHFEQDADPPLQVNYPVGKYTDPADGTVIDHKEIALEIGEDLREGATVAVPSDFYTDELGRQVPIKKWELAFIKGGENLKAFLDSANYLDIMKLRSLLLPEQALVQGQDQPSSRNVQSGYADIFKEAEALEAEDIDDQYNHHVIPQLLEANWGADAPPARKVTTGFDDDSMQLAQDLIKLAFQVDPNAIPINFTKLVKQANLPTYTAAEQQEREQQAAAQAAAAPPATPPPGTKTQGDNADVNASGQYTSRFRKRAPDLHLAGQIPEIGRQEFARRQQCVSATASRIQTVAERRYQALFEAAAAYVADLDTHLGLAQTQTQQRNQRTRKVFRRLQNIATGVSVAPAVATAGAVAGGVGGAIAAAGLVALSAKAIEEVVEGLAAYLALSTIHYTDPLTGELASLYHAAGAAELQRLGLDQTAWDVGRDDVQTWATDHAGELVKTMDRTVVDRHLAPFLHQQLSQEGFDPQDVADALSEKFKGYPHWMAERVARTEARMGFNQSAIDMWDRTGIEEVTAYDGFGGKSGQTDPHCLERNGMTFSLDEAREEDASEHPNGTLTFVPVIGKVSQLQPLEAVSLSQNPHQSESVYVVKDGVILSERETGEILASVSAD